MDYKDVIENAKKNIGLYCKVCPECNGIACRGKIPGVGGKSTGIGFIRNYEDIRKVKLNMDTFYDFKGVDTKCELFGREFDMPVFAAPVGGVQLHYSELYNDLTYSETIVKGCMDAGTLAFTGDGVNDDVFKGTLEAIRRCGGTGIATIKPWSKEEVLLKIKMAEKAGALAVAMDIDAAGLSILAAQGKPVSPMGIDTIKEFVNSTKLPFIIKGVMTKKAAIRAVEAGVYGIVVSNHGGRVFDETPSSMEVLEEIVEAIDGKIKVLIDGGFRSGLDVFKALALGADGVLIARTYAIAVYGGGVDGVIAYTNKIKAELENTMIMTGASRISDIDADKVRSPFSK